MRHRFALPIRAVAAAAVAAALLLTACSAQQPTAPTSSAEKPKTSEIVLASTTSTQDSGLFSVLIPAFEKDNPSYKVKVVAVGTGEALKLGEKKDADICLVHAKASELKFVAAGFGEYRKDVMYNDFVVVGPSSDPAGIKGDKDVLDAFKKLAAAGQAGKAVFVARGDDSGTAKKEESIWASATITPKGQKWYLSTGQGMGEVLKAANEKQGYTLADRATYLSMKDSLQLEIIVEGDKKLFNQYGVEPVVGAKNTEGAHAFADWITGPKGQAVIASYGADKFGQPLFVPNASQ